MATQVQNRRGTTAEHSTFTGANGELTVDTTKKTVVVHDGTTAGGAPLLRENGSQNAVTTGTSTAASFIPTSSTVPTNGVYLPAANTIGLATNSNGRVFVDSQGRVGIGTTDINDNLVVSAGNYRGLTLQTATSTDRPTVYFRNTGATAASFVQGLGQNLIFGRASASDYGSHTETARIDSSGRLLVGTSSARANVYSGALATTQPVQFETATNSRSSGLSIINNSNAGWEANVLIGAAGGTTIGSNTAVSNTAGLGTIQFVGGTGTNLRPAASISANVDGGTVSDSSMPGRLVFSTCSDGSASPSERYRITQDGRSIYYNTGYVYPNTDNVVQLGGPSNRFTAVYAVNGTIQTSDSRAKTQVTESSLGVNFVKSLRPVSYKWIEGGQRHTGEYDENNNYIYESVPGRRTHWGFIAQEVKEAADAAGVDFGGWVLTDVDDPDSQQALRYDQFIAPLTKALQETMAELEALKAEVAALKGA